MLPDSSNLPLRGPGRVLRGQRAILTPRTLPAESLDMEKAVDRANRASDERTAEREPTAERLGAA